MVCLSCISDESSYIGRRHSKGNLRMLTIGKRSMLMVLMVVFMVVMHENTGNTLAHTPCCEVTYPGSECYQEVHGPVYLECMQTMHCDGLICTLEVVTWGIIADTPCEFGYAWVGTYALSTAVH